MKLSNNTGNMYLDKLEFRKTEFIQPMLVLDEPEVIVTFPAFVSSNKNLDFYLVPEGNC